MRPIFFARAGALACALAACAVATAQTRMDDSTVPPAVKKAQKQEIKKGPPARWFKADRSKQARMRNKEREIAAAFREQQIACKQESKAGRSQCLRDARLTYEHDRSDVRALVANSPVGEVRGPLAPSEKALGRSQGGAEAAGGGNEQRGSMGARGSQGETGTQSDTMRGKSDTQGTSGGQGTGTSGGDTTGQGTSGSQGNGGY